MLGAQCLDMCLHVHDLTAALGAPADLRDHEAAAREACRLVLRVLPRLLVAAVGADDATLRVAVRLGDDRAVHVTHGSVVPGRPGTQRTPRTPSRSIRAGSCCCSRGAATPSRCATRVR